MLVNHVLSSEARSGIFDAIFAYFERFKPPGAELAVSTAPLAGADLHHFHRPHLETDLGDRAVVTVHHDPRDPDPWVLWDRFAPRYAEARHVVCLNSGQRRFLEERGLTRSSVIPHGYNADVLTPKEAGVEDGPITLGVISKFYERRVKGEALLMEIARRLHPDSFRWLLVGENRLVAAEALTQLGYEVRLFDHLPYRLFGRLYHEMDFLLVCSTFEGGPANIPEALGTATPVISTRVGFAPDLVEDEESGLLLSGDPDRDAKRIWRLADVDDPLRATLAAGARRAREETPTWREVVTRHFELYEALLGGTR